MIKYFLKQLPMSNDKIFMPYSFLKEITPREYVNVYYDEVESKNHLELCEELFEKFNINRPANFAGHSMSVSDIIEIIENNEYFYYYCDSAGFVLLNKSDKFKRGW